MAHLGKRAVMGKTAGEVTDRNKCTLQAVTAVGRVGVRGGTNAGHSARAWESRPKKRAFDVGFQVMPPLELMEIVYTSGGAPRGNRTKGTKGLEGVRAGRGDV
jgi:hypothetical protein